MMDVDDISCGDFEFALGLEPVCSVIKSGPCGAFQLWFELFCSNGIFSSSHVWHSHCIGHGHDCQIF